MPGLSRVKLNPTTALLSSINSHQNHWPNPCLSIVVARRFDMRLHWLQHLQLKIEALQSSHLRPEEIPQVSPVAERTAIQRWVPRNPEMKTKMSNAFQTLRGQHELQESKGGKVLREIEGVGVVERVDGLRIDSTAGGEQRQEAGCFCPLFARG